MDRKRLTFQSLTGVESDAPDHLDDPELYEAIRIRRMIAYLIDIAALLVLGGALWLIGGVLGVLTLGLLTPLVGLATVLLPFAYHTWFIGGPGNATLGMKALDIRVIAWNGNDPSFVQAAIQTVLFYATLSIGGLLLLASLFSPRGRCLHDILCGTIVVNNRREILQPD